MPAFSKLSRFFGIALLVAGAAACSGTQGMEPGAETTENIGSTEQHIDAIFEYTKDHPNAQFQLGNGAGVGAVSADGWTYTGFATAANVINTSPLDLPGASYINLNVDMHLSFDANVVSFRDGPGMCWELYDSTNGSFLIELLSAGGGVIDSQTINTDKKNELVQFRGKVLHGAEAQGIQVRISHVTSAKNRYARVPEGPACVCRRVGPTSPRCETSMERSAQVKVTVHDIQVYASWE